MTKPKVKMKPAAQPAAKAALKSMICLILDRSGSMMGRENDVIGGVNTFLDEQKKLPDPASVAFVRFDAAGAGPGSGTSIERFRPMQPLAKVEHLTRSEYQPRGGTPLLDAVGTTIMQLEEDWKTEKPDRCIVVVVTDGEENSSHEYTKAKVKELIDARQKSGLWSFIYLGANVDAFAEASAMGFVMQNTAGYQSTSAGTKSAYATVSHSVGAMRHSGHTVAHNLGGNIGEDGSLQVPPTLKPAKTAGGHGGHEAVDPTWNPPTTPSSGPWKPPA
jgi:uncharacterized protein YegL